MAKRKRRSATTDKIKRDLLEKRKDRELVFLRSGNTMLDLACSSDIRGGFAAGTYIHLVGDSHTGKTWQALATAAELCANPAFDDYRVIYDDSENGALMDIRYYFGDKLADRIEPPRVVDGRPAYSETIEQFYANLQAAHDEGRPYLYIEDSMDALMSEASNKKFDEDIANINANKPLGGSYGDGKAKVNSQMLRRVVKRLEETGSILIVISQTRDDISASSFATKTYSGGRALRFYATTQVWFAVAETLKKTYQGQSRIIGSRCRAKVTKSRTSGRKHIVDFPIFDSCGIDDVGAMIDFLIKEKVWKKSGTKIVAESLDIATTKSALIRHIEENDLEERVRKIVFRVWRKIEEHCTEKRKRRYQ